MLTIHDQEDQSSQGFCDGLNRRQFLKIGGLATGGIAAGSLSLTDLLAAEARAGIKNSHKAVIMVFLCGGPPHQDMFDLKPDAPADIRGEFKPIKTNVPGIEICELMPRLAKIADKYSLIRSLVGARDEHTSHVCMSGYSFAEYRKGDWPALGSVMSRVRGPVDPTVPPFVSLSQPMGHTPWANPGEAGFLGLAHQPFQPQGRIMTDMTLKDMSLARLNDRRRLLASVDQFRRDADRGVEGADALTKQAFNVLTDSKVLRALDLSKEDAKLRERYGRGTTKNVDDGGPMWNDMFLMSRRLVEAGVRCVTLGYGRWDYHGANFKQCRERLPLLDQGVSALIEDLHDRGLDQDVSVVVWGEFGRTPRINKDAGRDHWPAVSCALLAGGGMRGGQVIGSTTPDGGYADERPVHYKDVMATLYRNVGLYDKPVPGPGERPMYPFAENQPVEELI